jgi:hypothetical protein
MQSKPSHPVSLALGDAAYLNANCSGRGRLELNISEK